MHMHKAFNLASFKALDEKQGTFEAIVAVFGNIDRANEMVVKGAFTQSLENWQAKGRPIPVVFNHEWDNLDAHIGEVLEAREVEKGLWIKAQLEMDEPYAQRVYKKMSKGTLAEFSFAYDVIKSELWDRGEGQEPRNVTKLTQLELLEAGPTLVGMNPDTELLGIKRGARHSQKDNEAIQAIHDRAVELGAKCRGAEDNDSEAAEGEDTDEAQRSGTTEGKSQDPKPSTLASRVALELMEI